MSLSFNGLTVVITGAGGGLGKAYSLLYASRGANVVVNDFNREAAQKVVDEITQAGGKAAVNNASVTDGAAVIQTALDVFGGVHILINNAGILRDKSFRNMTDQEWDAVIAVHLKGAFSCTKAAWPHFRKQKFGRVINTASAAGLYGNNGQANYSAAKMGLVAFTKTLAKEGQRFGIRSTVIAPMAASAMTATVLPPDILAGLKPEFVAPVVLTLTHPEGPDANGKIFETGAGYLAEVRWERSKGASFKTDASFTPSAVLERWSELTEFDDVPPEHPQSLEDIDINVRVTRTTSLPSSPLTNLVLRVQTKLQDGARKDTNPQSSPEVRFDGKTVVVTGAGGGLGRAYSLMFAKLGANVVVNDVSEKGARAVVDEITSSGGKAVAAVTSAEDGEGIVKTALDTFGGLHILVANAGILRDKGFASMTDKEWDDVIAVHLRGTYKCAKAAWPIFLKQKYGRIITTASQVGVYGNFGQANYSTAKAAIIGFTRTIAIEGRRYNVLANSIAPIAGTAMTASIMTKEMLQTFKPEYVAPLVGFLSSEANEEITGSLFEVGGGWISQTRWQRAGGEGFPVKNALTPEKILSKWDVVTNFDDDRATNPSSAPEAFTQFMENFNNGGGDDDESPYADPEDSEVVAEAKRQLPEPLEFSYTERDVILYNLGIGASEKELQWSYEGHEDFAPLPTWGVVPQFAAGASLPMDWLPNYNPAKVLHGEQYLSIKGPVPTSGTMINQARFMQALDKGKAASVIYVVETIDKETGNVVFENQSVVFIRGSGGFGGPRNEKDRGAPSATNTPPKRAPDAVVEEKTTESQAALYRLSGDYNPLHILPEFAAIGGFDKPILHGLCSMGISGKHVLKAFGEYKDIKVRFAGVVYPGETLVTEMWKEGNKVIFAAKTKERNSVVLANAAVTLVDQIKAKL